MTVAKYCSNRSHHRGGRQVDTLHRSRGARIWLPLVVCSWMSMGWRCLGSALRMSPDCDNAWKAFYGPSPDASFDTSLTLLPRSSAPRF